MRYLPPELDRVVSALDADERTPIFRVDAAPFSRASWYVRLPGPPGGPWAGIVRCEASGALAVDTLRDLADRVTVTLGRFASTPHKDTRAPQNLYPIGGLERRLRHRLGDAQVLYRALRTRADAASGRFAGLTHREDWARTSTKGSPDGHSGGNPSRRRRARDCTRDDRRCRSRACAISRPTSSTRHAKQGAPKKKRHPFVTLLVLVGLGVLAFVVIKRLTAAEEDAAETLDAVAEDVISPVTV